MSDQEYELLLHENYTLRTELERLMRVIAELTENDELGCEYTYVNALKVEIKQLKRILADSIAGRDQWRKTQNQASELAKALKRTDEYLEGLSSGREIGTNAVRAGENAKRYAHQIQMEIRAALEKWKAENL